MTWACIIIWFPHCSHQSYNLIYSVFNRFTMLKTHLTSWRTFPWRARQTFLRRELENTRRQAWWVNSRRINSHLTKIFNHFFNQDQKIIFFSLDISNKSHACIKVVNTLYIYFCLYTLYSFFTIFFFNTFITVWISFNLFDSVQK